ncbi:MAG: hypothetical protein QXW71_00975 [Thermoplasmata archaeon]
MAGFKERAYLKLGNWTGFQQGATQIIWNVGGSTGFGNTYTIPNYGIWNVNGSSGFGNTYTIPNYGIWNVNGSSGFGNTYSIPNYGIWNVGGSVPQASGGS